MSEARQRAIAALNRTGQRCRVLVAPGCVGNLCESCDNDYNELRSALRALLDEQDGAGKTCPDCGGVGWIPEGDEQLGCIRCNGTGDSSPAPSPASDEVRAAAERLGAFLPIWIAGGTGEDAQLRYLVEDLLAALAGQEVGR